MTMTFTATLTCKTCKAELRFENERPAWKTYDYRVEQSEECERSAAFVTEHADKVLPERADGIPDWWPEAGAPRFIDVYRYNRILMIEERRIALAIPDPYRYVDCPVCDKHIKEPA